MTPIKIYTTRFCPYCLMAKRLLQHKQAAYEEIAVDDDRRLREEMVQRSGRRTVPQIWIGERHIGGYDDLAALDARGELDPLLTAGG